MALWTRLTPRSGLGRALALAGGIAVLAGSTGVVQADEADATIDIETGIEADIESDIDDRVADPALAEREVDEVPAEAPTVDGELADQASGDAVLTTTREPGAHASASPLPTGFSPGSTYGWRTSPRTGRRTFHAGLDFLAPRGTEVRAAAPGVVERVVLHDRVGRTRFGGYGRAVVVRHPGARVWTFYAHLDSVEVEVGQPVRAGQRLGEVGNSTNHRFGGMPTHLHFEVRRAAPGGRSPFPGPYRRFNLDPAAWLRSVGVGYGADSTHGA